MKRRMRTELISKDVSNNTGYGAGEGDTERLEYKCPCGAGKCKTVNIHRILSQLTKHF